MDSDTSLLLSSLAVLISGATAWFTLLRRGRLKMTRPSLVFFGPDGSRGPAKVFVRTFLLSTGHRGLVLEHLWVRLSTGSSSRTFGSWICGTRGELSRESGLFIGPEGRGADHHFLLPRGTDFDFPAGAYELQVHAKILGRRRAMKLWEGTFELDSSVATGISETDTGIFFDWQPDAGTYHRTLDRNRTVELSYIDLEGKAEVR